MKNIKQFCFSIQNLCTFAPFLNIFYMKIARTLLFLGTYLFIFNFTTFASPVDRATAQQIATNFWTSVAPGLSARWADITPNTDFHEFYLFKNTEGKGFVIIAADNCVQPVLG